MGSPENSNWVFDCPLIDDMPVAGGDFPAPGTGFYWTPQGINSTSNSSVEISGSFVDSAGINESVSKKRVRTESSSQPGSKACREKMRRDKLNNRFLELGSILEPGKPPKMDKAAILSDAVRMVTQLRNEAQKLKDSNEDLQEKIKELKSSHNASGISPSIRSIVATSLRDKLVFNIIILQAEKNELRDEKQRLKAEKENVEQQIKILNARPSFVAHPPVIPAAFAAQGQTVAHKLMMPVVGYPGFPMWQFMPPADVDTSQDAESCPPVA
ncbi:Transcription factor ILR3 [Cocos nucifera]|uniref:Transcription factor ILR3 n=1 Tax=Cocos nucifera TaxID=13894 RepID=A0A8K0N3B6_COCNU|nr:Transcription factor ILR3 [Cocos nucifera]